MGKSSEGGIQIRGIDDGVEYTKFGTKYLGSQGSQSMPAQHEVRRAVRDDVAVFNSQRLLLLPCHLGTIVPLKVELADECDSNI